MELSHPSRKNNDAARVGHPDLNCGQRPTGNDPRQAIKDYREPLNKCQIQENHSSGAKARVDYADFSGTAEAVPFQNRTYSELPKKS